MSATSLLGYSNRGHSENLPGIRTWSNWKFSIPFSHCSRVELPFARWREDRCVCDLYLVIPGSTGLILLPGRITDLPGAEQVKLVRDH